MLGAILRAPVPIPPLPAPSRPLLRRLPPAPMASSSSLRDTEAKKPEAPPTPAPAPQPPEKPLPGDCCGSGCVRCVWDVYYDELDAYNKALAAHSSSSDPNDKPPTNDKKAKS